MQKKSLVLVEVFNPLPVKHILGISKLMDDTSVYSLKVRHNSVKKLAMIFHN